MSDIALRCQCGQVQGALHHVSPHDGTRVICYCHSCQAFAQYLQHADTVLDTYGGTDIYQVAPAQFEITQGKAFVKSMRLTEKGLLRWYADCCKTPIANTVSYKFPFVGVIHNFFASSVDKHACLGPVKAHVNISGATKALPDSIAKHTHKKRYVAKLMTKILWWKLTGKHKPSALFSESGQPICAPVIANAVPDDG